MENKSQIPIGNNKRQEEARAYEWASAKIAEVQKAEKKALRHQKRLISSVRLPEQLATEIFNKLWGHFWDRDYDPEITQKQIDLYAVELFQAMYNELKLENKVNEIFALKPILERNISLNLSFLKESEVQDCEKQQLTETLCKNAVFFLNEAERTKIFELLFWLISDSKIYSIYTNLSPEKCLARIVGVSKEMVFRWKNKEGVPGQENTAKMLKELLSLKPDGNLKMLLLNARERSLQTYTLLKEVTENSTKATL
jgi:hypothetical protein